PFLEWREKGPYKISPPPRAAGGAPRALFAFAEMLRPRGTPPCAFFYLNDGATAHAPAGTSAPPPPPRPAPAARSAPPPGGAPALYRETPGRAIANFAALAKAHAKDPMVAVHAAPHSLHGASREMILAAHGAAAEAKVPMHIHLAEEAYQVDDALAAYGARPL